MAEKAEPASTVGGVPGGPEPIMQMLQGAQVAGTLNAAIQLQLFAAVAEGATDAEALARRLESPGRSTGILLDALVVLGLLTKQGQRYGLTALADAYLVPGRPMYVGDAAAIMASPMMWEGLLHLADAVRRGGTVLEAHAETPGHPFWETFAKSSRALAVPSATTLAAVLEPWMAARREVRVLDIAAGSGLYGYTLLQRYPQVTLTLLDWPNVLIETRRWAERLGVDHKRVRYREGNLFEVAYDGPYDLIVLGNVYHHFDPPTCLGLTRKVAAALAPGGQVAIIEFLADEQLSNPASTMFSIIMLMWTRRGQAYSAADYRGWLTQAGLAPPVWHPVPGAPASLLLSEKR